MAEEVHEGDEAEGGVFLAEPGDGFGGEGVLSGGPGGGGVKETMFQIEAQRSVT